MKTALICLSIFAILVLLVLFWQEENDEKRIESVPVSPIASTEEISKDVVTLPESTLTRSIANTTTQTDNNPHELRTKLRGRVISDPSSYLDSLESPQLVFRPKRKEDKSAPLLEFSESGIPILAGGTYEAFLEEGSYWVFLSIGTPSRFLSLNPQTVRINSKETQQVDFKLKKSEEKIRGRVVDCFGNPIQGVSLFIRGDQRIPPVRSDRDGQFEFAGFLPGSRAEIWVSENSLPKDLLAPWWQRLKDHEKVGLVHRPESSADTKTEFLVVLDRKSFVEGVLLVDDGTPFYGTASLRGQFAKDKADGGPNFVFNTDPDGHFQLEAVPSGSFEFRLYSIQASRTFPEALPFVIECGNDYRGLKILFPKSNAVGRLEGFVSDFESRPVAQLQFGVFKKESDSDLTREYWDYGRYPKAITSSDAAGKFFVTGLEDGDYILVRSEGSEPQDELIYLNSDSSGRKPFQIRNGKQTDTLVWKVNSAPEAMMQGRIVSNRISPARLRIVLHISREGIEVRKFSVPLVGAGSFRVERLFSGNAKLIVYSDGLEGPIVGQKEFFLKAGENQIEEIAIK